MESGAISPLIISLDTLSAISTHLSDIDQRYLMETCRIAYNFILAQSHRETAELKEILQKSAEILKKGNSLKADQVTKIYQKIIDKLAFSFGNQQYFDAVREFFNTKFYFKDCFLLTEGLERVQPCTFEKDLIGCCLLPSIEPQNAINAIKGIKELCGTLNAPHQLLLGLESSLQALHLPSCLKNPMAFYEILDSLLDTLKSYANYSDEARKLGNKDLNLLLDIIDLKEKSNFDFLLPRKKFSVALRDMSRSRVVSDDTHKFIHALYKHYGALVAKKEIMGFSPMNRSKIVSKWFPLLNISEMGLLISAHIEDKKLGDNFDSLMTQILIFEQALVKGFTDDKIISPAIARLAISLKRNKNLLGKNRYLKIINGGDSLRIPIGANYLENYATNITLELIKRNMPKVALDLFSQCVKIMPLFFDTPENQALLKEELKKINASSELSNQFISRFPAESPDEFVDRTIAFPRASKKLKVINEKFYGDN